MNTIILIIGLLLAFVTGFFSAIKSVQIGLKWQMQTKEGKEPELRSPIQPIIEAVQENKAAEINKQREQFMKEYSPFQD